MFKSRFNVGLGKIWKVVDELLTRYFKKWALSFFVSETSQSANNLEETNGSKRAKSRK